MLLLSYIWENQTLEKILDIADSIAYEKNISLNDVKDAIKNALMNTAKKIIGENYEFEVEFDEIKRKASLFQKVLVVANNDSGLDEEDPSIISLEKAQLVNDDAEIGDELRYEISLDTYGRGAANTMLRELEKEVQNFVNNGIYKKYAQKEGKIVSGQVVRIDHNENTYIELDEIRAQLPRKNRIKGEVFHVGQVVKGVLKPINQGATRGIQLEISRTSPKFLEELMRLEVPELQDGLIEIIKCARIPGERAKIALKSNSPRVDPIGTAVGIKGVRINSVCKELNNENIDVIEYSDTPEIFVSRAMSPAAVKAVTVDGKKAKILIADGNKSKAIGKAGVNIRLASMLTGYEIEIIGDGTKSEKPENTQEVEETNSNALAALFK